MNQTIFADVKVTRAGATAPIVRLPFRDTVLKPIQPRMIFITELLHLLKNVFLSRRQRLQGAVVVMDNSYSRRETQINCAAGHRQRILRVLNAATNYRIDVYMKVRVLG